MPRQSLAALWRRLRFHLRRAQFQRELEEEIRFHLELAARDRGHAGLPPDEARAAARRRFGNATRHREDAADVLAVGWVDAAAQDARYATRALRRSPVFTVVAVLSVALGIGATTAVFTLANVMLLKPLPYPAPERLAVVFQTLARDPREESGESDGVLLSESAARRLWPDGGWVVGRRVAATGFINRPPLEVIGVVRDVRFTALDRPPAPALYVSGGQMGAGPQFSAALLVRTRAEPATAVAALRQELGRADPTLAVYGVATVRELVRASASSTRFVAALLSGFALAAAFLAALGVAGALGSGGVPTRFLHGVTRADAATFSAIVLLLGTVGMLAALIPGRRAARLDPAITLRE